MLDNETKRRIDTARDILVGKVPDPKSQVEQITIALIYKFMDDMDMEAEELGGERNFFKGEYERYAWRKIFDRSLGGFEMLNLYSEAILKMNHNPQIPQLFRDIFKNAYLPYRDPETLKSFLKIINDFSYDHSEKLGDAFEYLLSVLGSQGDAGQFRTPRHIIDFMVEIIDPQKHETILDPACGTAGFLISAYKHILKNNSTNYDPVNDPAAFEIQGIGLDELGAVNGKRYKGDKLLPEERNRLVNNIRGYDISPDMVRLSLVNLYLHGFVSPNIFEYDTLTSEERWNEYADVILANPPFMSPKGGIRPHKRFSVTSNRSEVLFVDYMAEHLTPTGKAAIIVPEGIIFQSGTAYKALRKMLVQENYLVGVISLPAGVFNPYSGVKTSILWLDRSLAKRTDKILFVKIINDGFDLGAQRRPIKQNDMPEAFRNIVKYKTSLLKCEIHDVDPLPGFTVEEKIKIAESGDFNLSGDRYVKSLQLKSSYDFIKLFEISEFNNGLWQGKKEPFIKAKVIRNTNFQNDGFIDWSDIAELDVEIRQLDQRELQFGDIIIEKSGGGPTQPVGRVVFFDKKERGYSYSNFTSKIRIVDERIMPEFVWLILRDFYYKGKTEKFQQQTSGIRNLDFKSYQQINIPLPPITIQQEIVKEIEGYQKIIEGARQVVENWKPRINIDPEWPVVELGDVSMNLDGRRVPVTKSDRKEGIYPYYGASGIVDYVDSFIFDEDLLLVSEDGANLLARVTPIAFSVKGKIWVNNHAHVLRFENIETQKYVEYYLNGISLQHYITGSAQPKLNQKELNKIPIHLPNFSLIKEIVSRIEKENEWININMQIIQSFEQKIKDRIASVWGD